MTTVKLFFVCLYMWAALVYSLTIALSPNLPSLAGFVGMLLLGVLLIIFVKYFPGD